MMVEAVVELSLELIFVMIAHCDRVLELEGGWLRMHEPCKQVVAARS